MVRLYAWEWRDWRSERVRESKVVEMGGTKECSKGEGSEMSTRIDGPVVAQPFQFCETLQKVTPSLHCVYALHLQS